MKTKILLLLLLLISIQLFSQEKIQKYSKARIYYSSVNDLEILSQRGLAVDHGLHKKNVFIESIFSETEINSAKALGYQVEIEIDNMQEHIANRVQKKSVRNTSCTSGVSYNTPTNFELGSMGGFYTYAQMLQELDDMHTLYPDLISVKAQVGNFNTYENRPIYFVKISDNVATDEAEPEMLFTAIHHAREPASMQQLIFYMWYLLENYATNDEIKSIVDNTEQFFIPVLNVDGYIYNETTNPNGGGFWRKNRRLNTDGSRGVDNNRNYSYHWGESGVASSGSGETWPGTSGFSEPENQAAKWFTEQHNFVMAINNHTYSGLLLFPYGYAANTPTPENGTFEAISELMVRDNGYSNIISADLYAAAGDSDDWMYGDISTKNKIYAMTPEIGYSFWPSQSEIILLCEKMVFQNITSAHLITNYALLSDSSLSFLSNVNGNLNYTIKRLGLQNPANFTVSVVPVSSNIISIGADQTHNGMNLLQEDNGTISYILDNSTQVGDAIIYKLVLNNGQFYLEQEITKYYGAPQIAFQDLGTSVNNYNGTSWGISTAIYHSAPSSIADSTVGNYSDGINEVIELASTVDLTAANVGKLSFFTRWDIEAGWDYVQFEISTDNGNTWIPQCGNFTKDGTNQQGIGGQPMYDGTQNTWVKEEIDLSDYLGENIKFRFRIVSDGNTNGDGFYFDDFKVEVINSNPASVISNNLFQFSAYPNPFNDELTIDIPNITNTVNIAVYSINGQLIKKISTNKAKTILKINNTVSGIYFVKITADNYVKTLKVMKNK